MPHLKVLLNENFRNHKEVIPLPVTSKNKNTNQGKLALEEACQFQIWAINQLQFHFSHLPSNPKESNQHLITLDNDLLLVESRFNWTQMA